MDDDGCQSLDILYDRSDVPITEQNDFDKHLTAFSVYILGMLTLGMLTPYYSGLGYGRTFIHSHAIV